MPKIIVTFEVGQKQAYSCEYAKNRVAYSFILY